MQGITNENQLYNLSNKLDIKVNAIDTIENITRIIKPKGTYIILLHRGPEIGHWVTFNNGEYFDSFGEPPPMKIARFVKKYNKQQYQAVEQNYCGLWCILFLYARQHNKPDLINQMKNVSF